LNCEHIWLRELKVNNIGLQSIHRMLGTFLA
jgi:hypothetical protein